MKSAVIDASVAVKYVFQEPYSEQAAALIDNATYLHAPAHWLAEAATGLWSKVAIHRTLPAADLQPRLAFLASLPVVTAQLTALIVPAAALSLDLRLTLYDTLYLALAERQNAPLVSDDRKLIDAARQQARFKNLVVWIGDLAP